MKKINRLLAFITLLILLGSILAHAQSGGPYLINPSLVAGGGGSSTSPSHHLTGTIGQSLVGSSTGGAFALDAGFWNAAPACLSLSRASQSFAANGGNASLQVSGLSSCAWSATANDNWISITSGGNGNGDGLVTYTVAAHSNPTPRSGSLTIANQTFTVVQGAAFVDVAANHPFYTEIGKLSARGVTLGCGNGNYCPDQVVSREQMAAFILRAKGEFSPPLPAQQRFDDVPSTHPFYAFIDRLAVLEITLGCSANPPLYCPGSAVRREQMAAFLIRALHAPGYTPLPPAQQRFDDVPPSHPFYGYIEEMALRGITLGCSGNPPLYCPSASVTRGQMAAFVVRAFDL
jgi:hypothetical protein